MKTIDNIIIVGFGSIAEAILPLLKNITARKLLFSKNHDGPHFQLEPEQLGNIVVRKILSDLAKGRR